MSTGVSFRGCYKHWNLDKRTSWGNNQWEKSESHQPNGLSDAGGSVRPEAGLRFQVLELREITQHLSAEDRKVKGAHAATSPLLPFLSKLLSNWLYPLQNTFCVHWNLESTEKKNSRRPQTPQVWLRFILPQPPKKFVQFWSCKSKILMHSFHSYFLSHFNGRWKIPY